MEEVELEVQTSVEASLIETQMEEERDLIPPRERDTAHRDLIDLTTLQTEEAQLAGMAHLQESRVVNSKTYQKTLKS